MQYDINEDSLEEQELFRYARAQSRLPDTSLSDEDARTIISFAQNGLVDEDQLKSHIDEYSPYTRKLALFYLAYVQQLRDKGLMDYGEAIVRSVTILRNDVGKRQKWANKFDWVFCDEFQDTSPAQARLLDLIAQRANLFIVGDSAQSIYSWMGADPDNLTQILLDFPGTIPFTLSKNYRSFPKLVRVSNRFLEQCGQKHGIRVIWDEERSNENQNVYYLTSATDIDEAKEIALLAKDALKLPIPGEPPPIPSVGILVRKWELLKAVEVELIGQEIPYAFEGDTARGIRKDPSIQKIIDRTLDLITRSQTEYETGDTIDGKIINELRNGTISRAMDLLERVKVILGITDLSSHPNSDYDRLRTALGEKKPPVLALIYEPSDDKPKVILSTVHSQKGEEFDTVFVLGLEKGNSPHQPPRSHAQILEWRTIVQSHSLASWKENVTEEDLQRVYQQEEERIFYVAMTRARYNLIVGTSTRRNNRNYTSSEFLDKARLRDSVGDAKTAGDIYLATPKLEVPETGYRADGRMFWTLAGVRVRSKSEAILANELTRRGILYEYELAPENIAGALPDFTLPDFGGVIIEHLGLLDDVAYRQRWEQKKLEYEKAGRKYIATTEQYVTDIVASVDRILEECRLFAFQKYGQEWVNMIDVVQRLRLEQHLMIGRPVANYTDGLFYAEDKNNPSLKYVKICQSESETEPPSSLPGSLEMIRWTMNKTSKKLMYLGYTDQNASNSKQ